MLYSINNIEYIFFGEFIADFDGSILHHSEKISIPANQHKVFLGNVTTPLNRVEAVEECIPKFVVGVKKAVGSRYYLVCS